jgi:hypothetical protein
VDESIPTFSGCDGQTQGTKIPCSPSILSILITCLNMDALNKLHVAELNMDALNKLHVAELPARLVLLTTQDYQNEIFQQVTNAKEMKRQQAGQSEDSDSDDDSFASDDASMDRNAANKKDVDEKRARQSGYFVMFLIERFWRPLSLITRRSQKRRNS